MDVTEVRLRRVEEADLPLLAATGADPDVDGFNWFGYRSADWAVRRFEEDGFLGPDRGTLVVEAGVDAAAAAVGTVGWHAEHWGPRPTSRAWNIGIALVPEARGRGIGRRAQSLLVDHLFATTTANRVEATTDVHNIAEQRALEHAGFTREGVVRGAQFRDGAWNDLVAYAVLRAEHTPAG